MRRFLLALSILIGVAHPASAGFHDLLDAARANDTALAMRLLSEGTEPNGGPSGFPDSYTPLMWAAHHGNTQLIYLLLKAGADTERRDFNGDRALLWAARAGQGSSMVLLLAAKSPANSADDPYGLSPLMLAARGGDASAVRILIAGGANPDALDQGGSTALHEAALTQDTATVRVLLEAGANPNIADTILRETPLHIAATRQSSEIVRLLLAAGAVPAGRDSDGNHPLHLAALRGLPDNVAALLADGADPHAVDDAGMTPLLAAIDGKRHEVWDNDGAAALLVPFTRDVDGPFAAATTAGLTQTAILLLHRGADPNTPSALAGAARLEAPTLLDALLAAGADVHTHGTDALVAAASAGRTVAAQRLLDRGVPLDGCGSSEIPPIQAAAEAGELDMLRFLLDRGAIPIDPQRIRLAAMVVDVLDPEQPQRAAIDWTLVEARRAWERLRERQLGARAILAAAIAAR